MKLERTAVFSVLVACSGGLPTGSDASAPQDSSVESSPGDAADESPDTGASDADAETGVPTTYNSIGDTGQWETFDLVTYAGGPFGGAAWDGKKFVYFVPRSSNGTLVRYDTTLPFGSTGSWSKFDMTTVNANLYGFAGGAFANDTLYLFDESTSFAARFDTTMSFASTSSYTSFDVSTVFIAPLFVGGAFDGRYIYPSAPATNGFYALRYDTTVPFGTKSSWTQVNVANSSFSEGTAGAVFDGRWVYYAADGNGFFHRYDTTKSFTDTNLAWEGYPPVAGQNFAGGSFDGRYVYFAPASTQQSAYQMTALRYDTTQSFGTSSAWTPYLMGTNASIDQNGWFGTVFDGRYIFFVPFNAANGTLLERYDTTSGSFDASGFDTRGLTSLGGSNCSYFGGAFDGQYVYLVPSVGNALRFKAKSPPSVPATYHGSFL